MGSGIYPPLGDSEIKELCGSGTVTVGTTVIPTTAFETAGTINSGIGSTTDIDNPAEIDWTDFVDLSGEDYFGFSVFDTGAIGFTAASVRVNSAETTDNALRLQVIINEIIVFDIKVVADGSTNTSSWYAHTVDTNQYGSDKMIAPNSLKIRAVREGTFVNDDSEFRLGQVTYNILKRV